MKVNHEIIGVTLSAPLEHYLREFRGLENYAIDLNGLSVRRKDVFAAISSVTFSHLGFERGTQKLASAQDGLNVAVDLFFGNWWQEHKDWWSTEDEKNESIQWFDTLPRSLLLACVTESWPELEQLCGWCKFEHSMGYFGDLATEEVHAILLFADAFGDATVENTDKLREGINRCRLKRPKLLLGLLDSILDKNQEVFERSIIELLKRFSKSCPRKDIGKLIQLVAIVDSIFFNVGINEGLKAPVLTDKLKAHLVTAESIRSGDPN